MSNIRSKSSNSIIDSNSRNTFEAIRRIIRFREYVPYYLVSALACGFVAKFPIDIKLVPALVFVATSSIFGFVINDISDAELDSKSGKLRNPIASGDLSRSAATILGIIFLGIAILSLYPFDLLGKLLGIIVIMLFSLYSFGLRAKVRPGIDLMCHASWNALYGVLAYLVYRPVDLLGMELSCVLFFSSMLVELLNEIRDYDSEKDLIRTTTTMIGKKNALKLCIVILLMILSLFVGIIIQDGLPLILLVFSPSILFLVKPIINALRSEQAEQALLPILVSRGGVIITLVFITYLTVKIISFG